MAWAKMTQQWDTTVSDEEKPSEKARAIRARQRAIGRELRRMYDDVAQEPVPEDFLDLLRSRVRTEVFARNHVPFFIFFPAASGAPSGR